MVSGRAAWATRRLGSVQARRSCVAVSRATGGAPTYASRRVRLPSETALALAPCPGLGGVPECSASDLPVRRGSVALAAVHASHDFHGQTRNTYTTPMVPLEAHRGSHIITTSGLACNTVKHETPVVASFSSHRAHATRRARDAGSGIGMQRCAPPPGRRPRARSESSPDSLQTPRAACCGAVAGPRADTRAPDSASFAPASAWTGVTAHRHPPEGEAAAEPGTHTAIRQGRPQQSSGSTSRSPRADIHPL